MLALNSLWLLFGRIVTALSSLGITILLARSMGESLFGQFSYLTTYILLSATFANLGMDIYQLRTVAKNRTSVIPVGLVFLIQGCGALIVILATLFSNAFLMEKPELTQALSLYILILIPMGVNTLLNACFRGLEKMNLFVWVTLIDQLLQLTAVYFYVSSGIEIIRPLLINLLIAKGSLTIFLIIIFKWTNLQVSFSDFFEFKKIKPIIISGGWITLCLFFFILNQRMGILFLSGNSTNEELGTFSVANRVIEGLKILPASYYGALFPIMIQGGNRFRKEQGKLIPKFIFMLCFLLGLMLFSEPLMTLLFVNFNDSAIILRILCIGFIPFIIRQYLSFKLISQGNEKQAFLALFIATLFAFPLYYYLTLWFASSGLAWGIVLVLLSEVVILLFFNAKYRAD